MDNDNENINYDESLSVEELEDNNEQNNNNAYNPVQQKDNKEIAKENELNEEYMNKNSPIDQEEILNNYDRLNHANIAEDLMEKHDSNKEIVHQGNNIHNYDNSTYQDQFTTQQDKKQVFKLTTNTNNAFTGNTTMNKNSIHVRNPVPISKLQQIENRYYKLKGELDVFLDNCTLNDESNITISKQNKEMISYLDQLNNILTSIIDNTKMVIPKEHHKRKKSPPHQQQQQREEFQVIINTNNAKLVDVYKKEYLRLESRLKQVSEPNYQLNLEAELKELNDSLALVELENKQLKQDQKKNEIFIEKQQKNTNSSTKELTRISMDLEATQRQHQSILVKIDKRKMNITDNEIQINQLKELKKSFEKKAQEMYNITEYENVKEEEKNEKKIQDKRNHLKRKIEVLERVLLSNKKKYEMEIAKNEKAIFQLRIDKNELNNQLKETESKMVNADYKSKEEKKLSLKDNQKEVLKEVMKNLDEQRVLIEQSSQNTSGLIIKKNITKPKFDFKSIKDISIAQKKNEENPKLERQITDYGQSDLKDINIIVSNREEAPLLPKERYELKQDVDIASQEDNSKEEIIIDDNKDELITIEKKNVIDNKENDEKNEEQNRKNIIEHKYFPTFLDGLNDDDNQDNNEILKKEKCHEEPKHGLERKMKTEVIQKETELVHKSNLINFKVNENPLHIKSHDEFDQLEECYI